MRNWATFSIDQLHVVLAIRCDVWRRSVQNQKPAIPSGTAGPFLGIAYCLTQMYESLIDPSPPTALETLIVIGRKGALSST